MKDLRVRLDDDLVERLAGLSDKLSMSRSLMIRQAVTEYLIRIEHGQVAEEPVTERAEDGGESVVEVDRLLADHADW